MASAYDIFSDTEFGYALDDALRELSQYLPHLIAQPYKLEYRTGRDTAGTANYLTDTTESQFLAGDATAYKWIKNTTDNTWAVATSYSSTSVLGLSADIMDSGESYEMFNAGCSDHKSINIADVIADFVNVDHVEWPLGVKRNFTITGDILTLDIPYPTETDDLYVWVYVNYPHFISDLTDLAAAVNNAAGYAAGTTSMAIDGLDTIGTVKQGQEFTLVGSRCRYRVTADATITTGGATVTFIPALDIAVVDDAVITLIKTSLTQATETLVTEWAAAKAAINKPTEYLNTFCGEDYWSDIDTLITASTTQATSALSALTSGLALIVDNRATAETALGLMATASAQARTDIAAARAKVIDEADEAIAAIDAMGTPITAATTAIDTANNYFNTVNIGTPQVGYLQEASAQLSTAREYAQKALTHLQVDNSANSGYLGEATAENQSAMAKAAEAKAWLDADSQAVQNYISQALAQVRVGAQRLEDARTQLARFNAKALIPRVAQYYETWGKNKLALVLPRVYALASHQRRGPRVSRWESNS